LKLLLIPTFKTITPQKMYYFLNIIIIYINVYVNI